MARLTLRPARYRVATLAALVFLYAIVVTGALVRLTDSGLGCADWPNCNNETFVDVSSKHAAIEQINRLFTGAVVVAVALAVLGALLRNPRRRDLTRLSLGLVVGVFGQALLGAIVVWTRLNPLAVQGHFLLSMALMANAMVLHRRAGQPDGGARRATVAGTTRRHVWAAVGLVGLAVVTGTLVTGTGPHSGSVDGDPVPRFDFAVSSMARVHSTAVWLAIASLLFVMWRLRSSAVERGALESPITAVLVLAIVQGAVGYIQYFTGVPVLLVAVHVTLATAVWVAAVRLGLATTTVDAEVDLGALRPPGEERETLASRS